MAYQHPHPLRWLFILYILASTLEMTGFVLFLIHYSLSAINPFLLFELSYLWPKDLTAHLYYSAHYRGLADLITNTAMILIILSPTIIGLTMLERAWGKILIFGGFMLAMNFTILILILRVV